VLTNDRPIADSFEAACAAPGMDSDAQLIANWIVNDIMGLARARALPMDQLPLSADQIAELVQLVRDDKITARAAKDLLPQLDAGESPVDAATRLNLLSMDDTAEVLDAARAAVADNPAAVVDYKGGKGAAIGRLIGDVMRKTGGRAKPDDVRTMLLRVLDDDV